MAVAAVVGERRGPDALVVALAGGGQTALLVDRARALREFASVADYGAALLREAGLSGDIVAPLRQLLALSPEDEFAMLARAEVAADALADALRAVDAVGSDLELLLPGDVPRADLLRVLAERCRGSPAARRLAPHAPRAAAALRALLTAASAAARGAGLEAAALLRVDDWPESLVAARAALEDPRGNKARRLAALRALAGRGEAVAADAALARLVAAAAAGAEQGAAEAARLALAAGEGSPSLAARCAVPALAAECGAGCGQGPALAPFLAHVTVERADECPAALLVLLHSVAVRGAAPAPALRAFYARQPAGRWLLRLAADGVLHVRAPELRLPWQELASDQLVPDCAHWRALDGLVVFRPAALLLPFCLEALASWVGAWGAADVRAAAEAAALAAGAPDDPASAGLLRAFCAVPGALEHVPALLRAARGSARAALLEGLRPGGVPGPPPGAVVPRRPPPRTGGTARRPRLGGALSPAPPRARAEARPEGGVWLHGERVDTTLAQRIAAAVRADDAELAAWWAPAGRPAPEKPRRLPLQ